MQQKWDDIKSHGIEVVFAGFDEPTWDDTYAAIYPLGEPVVLQAAGAVVDLYKIGGTPANLLIDPTGRVRLAILGWNAEVYKPWMDSFEALKKD